MKSSTKKKVSSLVFLCAFTYFISYLTRKNFSTIIVAISSGTGILQSDLGVALTLNFIAYGVGQLISGFFGDKIQPKKLVALGLIVTVLMNVLIPIFPNPTVMSVLWFINGFAQAFMWPPIVKIMTSQLTDEEYKKNTQKVGWGSSLATVFLYLACPLIIRLVGWSGVFYFAAIGGIIGLIYWWITCPEIELKPKVSDVAEQKNKKSPFALVLIPVMVAIVLQGVLRDGVTDWMPPYIKGVFGFSDEISILTGVMLPIFAMICSATATWLVTHKIKNPVTCSVLMFGIGSVAAVILALFPSGTPVLSIAMFTIITACMHGVNLLLICIVPGYFKRTGNVSMISGVLNCCTYVGSALSAYVIPLIAESAGGWNLNLLIWAIIGVVGTAVCLFTIPGWKKFEKKLDEEYPVIK